MTFLLSAALCISLCSAAYATPSRKFAVLLRFFDLNEAALAYHRQCLSEDEPLNQNFSNAMKLVADNLLAEGMRDNPRTSPQEIKSKILERRDTMQLKLDTTGMKEGCYSKNLDTASAHYRQLSSFSEADVNRFIEMKIK